MGENLLAILAYCEIKFKLLKLCNNLRESRNKFASLARAKSCPWCIHLDCITLCLIQLLILKLDT